MSSDFKALFAPADIAYVKTTESLISQVIPEEPQDFENYVDDDGRGFGPYKVKVTIWRKGDKAYFDYTGTDPQSEGPVVMEARGLRYGPQPSRALP